MTEVARHWFTLSHWQRAHYFSDCARESLCGRAGRVNKRLAPEDPAKPHMRCIQCVTALDEEVARARVRAGVIL